MISSAEALARVAMTSDESRAQVKFEASIDTFLRIRFDGTPVRLDFNETIPPKIAAAIQRSYEAGGWKASFAMGAGKCSLSLTPTAAMTTPIAATVQTTALPPVASTSPVHIESASKRLLVRMPTRGRPAQALKVLELYREMAGCPIQLEVVIDEDDETMLAAEVQQRLVALGCTITVGRHKSKIEAVNAGRLTEWDVLLLASDDMFPEPRYAARALEEMDKHFPHLDGAIYFDDGMSGADLCTLPIIGRRLHAQFNNAVYEPAYASLFSDTEQTAILKAMDRLVYVNERIIEHRHHVWGKADVDDLYKRNDALFAKDKDVFEVRSKMYQPGAQWPFNAPPLRLSICIATIPSRAARLEHLLDHLWNQILSTTWNQVLNRTGNWRREVEIVIDSGEGTIGEKRQRLLEKAKGHHVAFCDDDDWVAFDYVSQIIEALRAKPDVDCVSINGVMTTAGAGPEPFEHSIKHAEWRSSDGKHYRGANHLNPIRRELALKVGFQPVSTGEDLDFARRIQPLLKTEASTVNNLYFYLYEPVR